MPGREPAAELDPCCIGIYTSIGVIARTPGRPPARAGVPGGGRSNLDPTALPHPDCLASPAMTATFLIPTLIINTIVRPCYIGVSSINARGAMSETERNYAIGYGKPPEGRRFRKGQSGNPGGPRGRPGKNNLSALLLAALDEPVTLTIDGHRRKITKREAIVTQMVDQSAAADLRATKMLIDMLKEVEEKAGTAASEPAKL